MYHVVTPCPDIECIFQMSEETHNAAIAGSIGIIMVGLQLDICALCFNVLFQAIGVSSMLGLFLILGLLFSIQDIPNTLASPTQQPVLQICLDVVGKNGAILLMVCSLLYSE
jgi:hypothetical protein